MSLQLKEWRAEYKGTTVTVKAKDLWRAKNHAAIELGVPSSRQKHIRMKEVTKC